MKALRTPPTSLEDLVLFADLRMDGVQFARVANDPRSCFRGVEGGLSLCYFIRSPALWVEIAPPGEASYEVALPPGSILSASGVLSHWFKPQAGGSTARAAPISLAPIPERRTQLDMLVGFIPDQVLANTNLIIRELFIPPRADDTISRRIISAFEAIEDEVCAPHPLGGIDSVIRR